MSKKSKARRDELIRSMEGLAVLKQPKRRRPLSIPLVVKLTIGLIVIGAILSAAYLWLNGH